MHGGEVKLRVRGGAASESGLDECRDGSLVGPGSSVPVTQLVGMARQSVVTRSCDELS
jgi:hypothetical protein